MDGPSITEGLQDTKSIAVYLTAKELSHWLAVPIATISYWRTTRQGPPFHRVGRHVRYNLADVNDWLSKCKERL